MRLLLKYGLLFVIILILTQSLLATEKKAANSVSAQNQEITEKADTSCDWATIITLAKDFLTGVAIILGGIWTYILFIRTRQKFPRANIIHDIKHLSLPNDKTLLHIDIRLSNVGDVLLSLASGEVRVQQVLPLPDELANIIEKGEDPVKDEEREIEWPLIGERSCSWKKDDFEVEPGESDNLLFDFIIEKEVKVVEVYSYFQNIKKRPTDIGWNLTTVYDLRSKNKSGANGEKTQNQRAAKT